MKVVLLACMAAALLTSGAAAEPMLTSAKKCPRGKVAVKVLGKRSCRPVAAALPRPRKGDELVPLLQHGLDPTWGETRDGPRTLEQLLGPETKRALDLALQRSLGRLSGAGQRRLSSALAGAAAKCKSDRVLPITSETYKEDLGAGNQLDVQFRTGPEGASVTMGLTVQQGGGRAVRISIDLGLCSGEALQVDPCPTAQGVVEGTDNYGGTIRTEELEDGEAVSAHVVKVTVETKLRGQVEEDAKLSEIRIERTESYDVAVTHGRWLGVGQKSKVRRAATISMPSGTYNSQSSNLEVQQSFSGILSFLVNESAARAAAIADLERSSNKAWAAFVDETIRKYRERERDGWQKPNACAKLEFTPKSDTLRVFRGQRGQFSGTVRAQRGGSPQGTWKLKARKRLALRPEGGKAAKLPFDYRVEGDGDVSATFRVTSRAGLAEGTWKQGERKLPRRVTGSFSGTSGPNGVFSWSGTVTFVRAPNRAEPSFALYEVENVVFTVTYVVDEFGCSGRSEGRAALGSQPTANLLVSAEPDGRRGHRYLVSLGLTAPPAQISVTCAGVVLPPREWVGLAVFTTIPNTYYSDLKTFSGTNAVPGGGSFTWDLRGSS